MRLSDVELNAYIHGCGSWGSLQAAENIAFDLRYLRNVAKNALLAMKRATSHMPIHFDWYFEAIEAIEKALEAKP